MVRPREAEDGRLRRPRHARTAARDFAVCKKRLHFPRAIRARKPPKVRRGSIRSAAFGRSRRARKLPRERLFRFQSEAAEVRTVQSLVIEKRDFGATAGRPGSG